MPMTAAKTVSASMRQFRRHLVAVRTMSATVAESLSSRMIGGPLRWEPSRERWLELFRRTGCRGRRSGGPTHFRGHLDGFCWQWRGPSRFRSKEGTSCSGSAEKTNPEGDRGTCRHTPPAPAVVRIVHDGESEKLPAPEENMWNGGRRRSTRGRAVKPPGWRSRGRDSGRWPR